MLERLWIRNYALITELTIDFTPGFSILTGETGAGKSILIGALGLVLGAKGDVSAVRTGAEETSVAAQVSVHLPQALRWLEVHGIEPDEGSVLIKRNVRTTGRGSITIEDVPVTRKELSAFTAMLFSLYGQHDHHSLSHPASQLRLLDSYGELGADVLKFASLFAEFAEAKRELKRLQESSDSLETERELLSFAVEEIETAAMEVGEDEEIARQINMLDQYEKLNESMYHARELLDPQQGSVGEIRNALKHLELSASIDESLSELSQRLSSARYELEDIFEEVRKHQESLEFSPERLDELNGRMQEIRRLKKKYGPSIEEVLSYADDARHRLDAMEHRQEHLEKAEAQVRELSSRVQQEAGELTRKRRKTAAKLEPLVSEHLTKLGMPNAQFSVAIEQRTDVDGKNTCSAHGADAVTFMFSANLGEPSKPLSAVASGGELSRIMLALKSAAAGSEESETLIFDEIDTGIGGAVAVAVGEHLRSLASGHQVLCISHLAAVAAKADSHIVVEKFESGERTITRAYQVDSETRIKELARMLSGTSDEQKALDHARMLLKNR
jgi:DNA repair protein RecN (Recombination protein N)